MQQCWRSDIDGGSVCGVRWRVRWAPSNALWEQQEHPIHRAQILWVLCACSFPVDRKWYSSVVLTRRQIRTHINWNTLLFARPLRRRPLPPRKLAIYVPTLHSSCPVAMRAPLPGIRCSAARVMVRCALPSLRSTRRGACSSAIRVLWSSNMASACHL